MAIKIIVNGTAYFATPEESPGYTWEKQSFTELNLSGNRISGSIPPEISKLSSLNELDLGYNELSGSIPPEISKLSSLWKLDLSSNLLAGTIPLEMASLSRLTYLYLSDNSCLTGGIPDSFLS